MESSASGYSCGWLRTVGRIFLLVPALLAGACSGDKGDAADDGLSANEVLILPQLKAAGTVHEDVRIRLRGDGTWELLSIAGSRAATEAETASAVMAGKQPDLSGAQTDATLEIARGHIGTKVFGKLAIRLTGKTWSVAGKPQEYKALTLADFKSNPLLQADESHHVMLQSGPGTAVQGFPLRLKNRAYRFCMDAQEEGADSITLLDASQAKVFSLSAGDPCVMLTPAAGLYTLQHRYGGNGARRMLFFRNPANVQAAQAAPAVAGSGQGADLNASFPQTEYWSVFRSSLLPPRAGWLAWEPAGVPDYPRCLAQGFADPICGNLLDVQSPPLLAGANFLRVGKSSMDVPATLGAPLSCSPGDADCVYGVRRDLANRVLGYAYRDLQRLSGHLIFAPVVLNILPGAGNDFQLSASRLGLRLAGLEDFGAGSARVGVDAASGALVVPAPSATFSIGIRYFPDGLAVPASLAPGQVVLYAQSNCQGPAILSEGLDLPNIVADGSLSASGFGASVVNGPNTMTTLYSESGSGGLSQKFGLSTCDNNPAPWAAKSMTHTIDTVELVISTHACEYCNLAGLDLSGQKMANFSLQHVNLSDANISSTDLTGADMRFAVLQGASLSLANLEATNLCSAQLNGGRSGVAASLSGAHLKNTNLALANLDGADFSNASFYGSAQMQCPQDCNGSDRPACASAYGATMNNTRFGSAYLADVDMGKASGAGVSFTNAMMAGVSLRDASLSSNVVTGQRSSFEGASMDGVDFSNAGLSGVNFAGAKLDLGSNCMQLNLGTAFTQFPGYQARVPPLTGKCAASPPAIVPLCLQVTYTPTPAFPRTDCSNICADNSGSCPGASSCSVQSWGAGKGSPSFPSSACHVPQSLCGNSFTGPDPCW